MAALLGIAVHSYCLRPRALPRAFFRLAGPGKPGLETRALVCFAKENFGKLKNHRLMFGTLILFIVNAIAGVLQFTRFSSMPRDDLSNLHLVLLHCSFVQLSSVASVQR